MDITTRNFFNLLRAGAFNEKVEIEPMSAWKWRQVYHYSLMHGVSAIVYDGIMQCQHLFFLQTYLTCGEQRQTRLSMKTRTNQ